MEPQIAPKRQGCVGCKNIRSFGIGTIQLWTQLSQESLKITEVEIALTGDTKTNLRNRPLTPGWSEKDQNLWPFDDPFVLLLHSFRCFKVATIRYRPLHRPPCVSRTICLVNSQLHKSQLQIFMRSEAHPKALNTLSSLCTKLHKSKGINENENTSKWLEWKSCTMHKRACRPAGIVEASTVAMNSPERNLWVHRLFAFVKFQWYSRRIRTRKFFPRSVRNKPRDRQQDHRMTFDLPNDHPCQPSCCMWHTWSYINIYICKHIYTYIYIYMKFFHFLYLQKKMHFFLYPISLQF